MFFSVVQLFLVVFFFLQKFPSPYHWVTASGIQAMNPMMGGGRGHTVWSWGGSRVEFGMEPKKASMGLVDLPTFAISYHYHYKQPNVGIDILQGTNISHLGKRKIIFKMPFWGDMLVFWMTWRMGFFLFGIWGPMPVTRRYGLPTPHGWYGRHGWYGWHGWWHGRHGRRHAVSWPRNAMRVGGKAQKILVFPVHGGKIL